MSEWWREHDRRMNQGCCCFAAGMFILLLGFVGFSALVFWIASDPHFQPEAKPFVEPIIEEID